ncbi:uncharacterized protein LOC126981728 isoform X2 [Eriocheir sinensis]|uniref:uncharacterized protein LOC126981728 isoform X2 n=1 Tax=Eriocheir sinensis TaxID=95602 RepID=UPI0021CA9794|nr:uncharacterized protein LOC126981728 isoform X2 [Eriocheir sinensis]
MNTLALKQEASERLYACELSLISKVKEHPHLYDFNHRDYKDTQKCIQTWFNIAQELGIRPEKWSVCKERWRTLRDVYVRNRKCYLMGGERARKRNKWKYFDEMNFLHPYINHRAFEAEKDAHDNRILWQNIKQSDTESDSDSNEAAPFGQQRSTISPNIEAQVLNSSLKRELSEEDEEGQKVLLWRSWRLCYCKMLIHWLLL